MQSFGYYFEIVMIDNVAPAEIHLILNLSISAFMNDEMRI